MPPTDDFMAKVDFEPDSPYNAACPKCGMTGPTVKYCWWKWPADAPPGFESANEALSLSCRCGWSWYISCVDGKGMGSMTQTTDSNLVWVPVIQEPVDGVIMPTANSSVLWEPVIQDPSGNLQMPSATWSPE